MCGTRNAFYAQLLLQLDPLAGSSLSLPLTP
jgi:hypothetical protein